MSRIIIVGAGVGGLCLAQGLARAGIAFEVLEADAGPWIRGQGYRLRIDAMGQQALRDCLPTGSFALFQASCAVSGSGRFVDAQLRPLRERRPDSWRENAVEGEPDGDMSADRQVLRDILSHGLAPQIRWGCRATRCEREGDGIAVHCEDGRVFRGDLAVAADGLRSALRRQWLPQAEPESIGALNIYGKVPLADAGALEPVMLAGPTVAFADGCTLVVEPMRFRAGMAELADRHAPGCRLSEPGDYLYWALFGRTERLGGPLGPDGDEEGLRQRLQAVCRDWHPSLSGLLARSAPASILGREARMAAGVPVWRAGRLTALGDAIHAMSPAGGVGANTALADAAMLARCLAEDGVEPAVARYEAGMRMRAEQALAQTRAGTERLLRLE
ncbi:FAD-dependent monooxygenase [Chromobacterium phragmitis]|uniref:FAD-dependent oxidoreductase n=1 Tax=Chromobacterium phragmitis TaxID=2202141 RepID=UPI000DEC51FE|nr:NAD(P)/FAD-dependent oxidoreductase [Chromobacterium phragmitis]AXE31325.1 FAD-dependent monooxygenase [Chromobacterium phragmitis]